MDVHREAGGADGAAPSTTGGSHTFYDRLFRRNDARLRTLAPALALTCAVLLAVSMLLVGTANAKPPKKTQAAPALEPVLEPKAIDLLKVSSARLAAARSMTFTAINSYESPSRPGPSLLYTTKDEVALQRPDKLRVRTLGDGPPSEFYYDGKTMTAFAPAENLAATSAAEPTIDAALQAAYNAAAIYYPFTDFVVADP